MAESLLAHLYSRIKGSQEDVETMSLQYILSSSEKLNEAFNRFISDSLKFNIDLDISYTCQSVGENSERPDISGTDKSGKEVVLCEMKFYAGLTENQPNGYLDRLIKEDGKALVFVCPEQRKVSLWSKVKDLCEKNGRELSEESDFRVTVDGIAMTVVSWAQINEMLRKVASASAVEALPDIAQLEGFCNMMDSSAFIPFSSEDFGPEYARREERHFQVIDRLFDTILACKEIKASRDKLKAAASREGYARYLKINDFTFGLLYNRPAWISPSSAETPFWCYFKDSKWNLTEEMEAKLKAIPERERERPDKYSIYLPLYAPTDVGLDEVAEGMLKQIIKYLELLEK